MEGLILLLGRVFCGLFELLMTAHLCSIRKKWEGEREEREVLANFRMGAVPITQSVSG